MHVKRVNEILGLREKGEVVLGGESTTKPEQLREGEGGMLVKRFVC